MPPDYQIAVVARTLDVIEMLADADEPVGLADLARQLDLTKSSVFRILVTLEQRGYVAREPSSGRYRLGSRLPYLGSRALRSLELRQVARPALESLHHRFRETVNLGVLDGTDIVYLDMIESDRGLRMAARLGRRDPAFSTSLGKAILAFLPPDVRARSLPEVLAPRTEATITDFVVLDADLARVRERGFAEDRGENEAGALCFGAPIFDYADVPIAAISLSAPESRIGTQRDHIGMAVRAAAADVTRQLGGKVREPGATL